jgi:hypothetical protein
MWLRERRARHAIRVVGTDPDRRSRPLLGPCSRGPAALRGTYLLLPRGTLGIAGGPGRLDTRGRAAELLAGQLGHERGPRGPRRLAAQARPLDRALRQRVAVPPAAAHRPGDRLVTYAVGSARAFGTGRVFSVSEVTSDPKPGGVRALAVEARTALPRRCPLALAVAYAGRHRGQPAVRPPADPYRPNPRPGPPRRGADNGEARVAEDQREPGRLPRSTSGLFGRGPGPGAETRSGTRWLFSGTSRTCDLSRVKCLLAIGATAAHPAYSALESQIMAER